MAKISVLIPIYNVEPYLAECLESVLNQTEHDLEIICVDDASTDNSLEILNRYATLDSRITIIRHLENKGLCQTRKDAVLVASGKYIMFLDSDDYLSLNACQELYETIERFDVDFLQFGAELLPGENISEEIIQWVADFMEPTTERLEADSLVRACFIEHKFNCNLVNKIWNANLCKKAFEHIPDGYCVSAEDRYAVFVCSYFALTYAGVAEKYYHYRLGVGITGGDVLNLERFQNRCTGALVSRNVDMFLQAENAKEKFSEELQDFKNQILWDCVHCWKNKLPEELQGQGYDILLHYWSADEIVGAIGRMFFEDGVAIQKSVAGSSVLLKTKTIGIYYRNLGYAPMFKYINSQIKLIHQAGCDAVLFSDKDASVPEHSFPNEKVILLSPSKKANWDSYFPRGKEFKKQLEDNHINAVFYASPTSHIAWLDALLIRSMEIPLFYVNAQRVLPWQEKCLTIKERVRYSATHKMRRVVTWLSRKFKKIKKGNKVYL